jgi:DNA polymerase-3 subunit gamma/tau
LQVLAALAEFVHFVTRAKVAPNLVDPAATQIERERGGAFAQNLSMSVLSRAWQILLKGLQEIKDSPRPLAAADMVLVRLAYAADLPSPEDVLKNLSAPDGAKDSGGAPTRSGPAPGSGGGASAALRAAPRLAAAQAEPFRAAAAPTPDTLPKVVLKNFAELIALASTQRDIQTKTALERDVRLVRFEQGVLEFALAPGGAPGLPAQLSRKLQEWTGQRWMVALSSAPAQPSLSEQAATREEEKKIGVQAHPLVRAALDTFPGAVIVAIRGGESEPEDVAYIDETSEDEDF